MNKKKKVRGQLGIYLQWPLILGILVVLTNVAIGVINTAAGLAMCLFTLVYLSIAVFLYVYKKRGLLADLVEFSADYAWVQKKLLSDLDLPYAMTDEAGRILWMNEKFSELIKGENNGGRTLPGIFPDITKEVLASTFL